MYKEIFIDKIVSNQDFTLFFNLSILLIIRFRTVFVYTLMTGSDVKKLKFNL